MKLSVLEKSILKNFTYYHIVIFEEAGKNGRDYPIAYKREKNALKAAQQLFNTGKYHEVLTRREEVISQIPDIEYYSINSPIKSFIKEA